MTEGGLDDLLHAQGAGERVPSGAGRGRGRLLVALAVTVGLLAAVAGGVVWRQRQVEQARAAALAAATGWLAAWEGGEYAVADGLTVAPDRPGDALRRTDERLQAVTKRFTPGALSADGSSVPYDAVFTLRGLGELTWSSRVRVATSRQGWRVAFDSATVHPRLRNGQRLDRQGQPGERAAIVDRTGAAIRPASADLAANVLGRPPTEGGQPTGLERVLDARLTGRATGQVVVSGPGNAEADVLQAYEGTPPVPVRTTLDLRVQAAAERALAGLGSPAALVAVDSASGQVRAVANSPVSGKPRAFTSYAPGSVFKTVTAAALLSTGSRPDSPLDCPDEHRGIGNAGSVRPGPGTLSTAFAQSCNTAFLAAAETLPDGALEASARFFGFADDALLPIAVDAGRYPPVEGPGDATAPIGQGRVEATPLLVASMMAAVESGTWRRPALLAGPPAEGRPASRALPPPVADGLRRLLRTAVSSGSASAVDLAGPPVAGKTGSAQTGTGEVHAWFAGYRDGTAFAVFVEQGASGAATAVPVAARFLQDL